MLKELYVPKFQKIDCDALAMAVSLKYPIPEKEMNDFLKKISDTIPVFSKIEPDDDKKTITFKNNAAERSKQITLIVQSRERLILGWGENVPANTLETVTENYLNILGQTVEITRFNLEFIDYKVIASIKFKGNHNIVINNIFHRSTPLSCIFNEDLILDNDVNIRGFIDKQRICVLSIIGQTTTGEVINGEFQEKPLKIEIGVAKIEFNKIENIKTEVIIHMIESSKFIRNTIEPEILNKIENYEMK